jgi:hypothetical protein
MLKDLLRELKQGNIHVIGRTQYRSALVQNHIERLKRDDVKEFENLLSSKDNHVVLLFQVRYNHGSLTPGIYYMLLSNDSAILGRELLMVEW